MNAIELGGDEPTDDYDLPTLYSVGYCSRAAAGMDEATVARIVSLAQHRNPVYGITGVLMFGNGVFFQFLEGPRDHVIQLMVNITSDTRHDTVVALSQSEEVRERLFPTWAMERVTVEDIRAVLEDALSSSEHEKNVPALQRLLQQLDSTDISGSARS